MKESTKERLIAAANRIISEQSYAEFTLEKVAQEAGVSKGGLLHYFPSKDALITGMLEALHHDFAAHYEAKLPQTGEVTSKMRIQALAETSLETLEKDKTSTAGLLAAVASKPELLKDVQEQDKVWREIMDQSADPVLATILSLALDGLCIGELFGILNIDEEMKAKVKSRILAMVSEHL